MFLCAGITHVRLFLPQEEFAEPVEINLKDARDVKAESLAYKVIRSMPRDVGCDKDGFRQGACQIVLQLCFMFAHLFLFTFHVFSGPSNDSNHLRL